MNTTDTRINLITGGAGFVGSHLVDSLISRGEKVICLDNFSTGRLSNISHHLDNPLFQLVEADVMDPISIKSDRIWHLACPASPKQYQKDPILTSKINFLGALNTLELAHKNNSRILLASTSEVYGDPEIHPQPESYKGSVNTTGIRSCYDEGKRISETLFFDFKRMLNVDIRVVRIFNTYGPRMDPSDGRVVSNFIVQALESRPLTLYGEGKQTRSFCYVADLVDGLIKMMESHEVGPINLGNPNEFTISELAELVRQKINPALVFSHQELPQDDPMQRQPVITLAREKLGWEPSTQLSLGLDKTIHYLKSTY